jgi:hypothetical protein
MSIWDVLIAAAALAVGIIVTAVRMRRRPDPAALPAAGPRILFPFVGTQLSERALQAALRLARAEQAVIVPSYLATIPMQLDLDAPVGNACEEAFSVFEAIEARAAAIGVAIDGRIVRGRNVRHALRELITEIPDARRIVVAAATDASRDGFSVDDVAWLLRNAPGEVLVLRPAPAPHAEPYPSTASMTSDALMTATTSLPSRSPSSRPASVVIEATNRIPPASSVTTVVAGPSVVPVTRAGI